MNRLCTRTGMLPLAILAGLLLRAMVPVGYMPGSLDSGLPFQLCPDGLPAGFAGAAASHHHEHDAGVARSAAHADCNVGHLLSSAFVTAASPSEPASVSDPSIQAARIHSLLHTFTRRTPLPRAPPVLHG